MRWVSLFAIVAFACKSGGTSDDADGDGVDTDEPTNWSLPPCVDDTFEPIVQDFDFVLEDVAGWPALVYVPENPRGVVVVFHGSGGSAAQLNTLHYGRLWSTFVWAGFGVIGTESQNRGTRTWDLGGDPTTNEDFAQMSALRDALIARGDFAADTPLWSWGFSNGASYSAHFANLAAEAGWPIRGATLHNGSGPLVGLPTFITSSENDDITPAAKAQADDQAASGQPSQWIETLEHPWYRDEMLINAFYDEEESSNVFDELVSFSLIDDAGIRLADIEMVDGLMNVYESNSTLPGPSRVTVEIRVAWATHRGTSETACEERDFMVDNL